MEENKSSKVMWEKLRLCEVVLLLSFSVVLAGCLHSSVTKRERPEVISRKQSVADLDYLVKQLKAKHPSPFERISKKQFGEEVKQLKDGLGEQVNVKDFSLSITRLLALIRDGHTRHKDFSRFHQHKNSGGKVFPIRFRYEDGLMKVAAWSPEVEQDKLKKGDVVLSVNGESMESVLQRYGAYVSADADVQRHWAVEAQFAQYHFLVGDTSCEYRVVLRGADGQSYEVTLGAVRPWLYRYDKAQPSWPLFYHEFYHDGKICLFKAQSFANKLYKQIEKKTDAIIAEMKERGTEVLVFDLRNNGGGNGALGAQLLRKTIDRQYGEFTPHPKRWHGKLVVLCDRWSMSAASWLATVVKDYKIGIIAGEETGGRASFYGNIEHVYLPHSGLSCGISTRLFMRPAGYNDGRGVLPDLTLDVTVDDEIIVEKIAAYVSSGGNSGGL